MSFFQELKRRNVVRVGIAYVVSSWLLLQLTEVLYELLELPAWAPRLVILLLLIGFIPALVFAWIFEMTEDGIKREKDIDRSQSITPTTGRKLDRAIIVALTLALAYFVADRFWLKDGEPASDVPAVEQAGTPAASNPAPQAAKADEKSIAVLPFANRSPDPTDAFFAEGVHDDLLTHLSKIGDLHVISRTSVMGYANTTKNISDIGNELGVATIMEGAVQRAGNRVRINVQLIDAETDAHLWAEIYDRELTADTVFEIQSEITKAIADALDAILSETDQAVLEDRPTESLAAYDAFIQGKLQAGRYFIGENELLEGIENFDRAIALDPNFGQAYAYKAYAQVALFWYTAIGGDWLAEAEKSLQMAEALAPDAVETLTARAYWHYWGHLDYASADAMFDRALERAPNFIEAFSGKAFVARRDGRFDEALTLLEMGRRLDPLNTDLHSSITETLAGIGRHEEAMAAVRRATRPDRQLLDPMIISLMWEYNGNAERAWQNLLENRDVESTVFYNFLVFYAIRTRDPENVRYALAQWPEDLRRPENAPEAYELARARSLSALGRADEARAISLQIKQRIDAADNPYPEGWQANALYHPMDLPGLLGDLEGVQAAWADFEANHPPDAWAEVDFLIDFAEAFIRAGAPETAIDRLGEILSGRGPWTFNLVAINPAFDSIRDHPRYLEMKARYEAWAAESSRR